MAPGTKQEDVTDLLVLDSSESDGVYAVHVGASPQCVKVSIQGVPMYGIVDTGADITIIGAKLFRSVATKACLKKKTFSSLIQCPGIMMVKCSP